MSLQRRYSRLTTINRASYRWMVPRPNPDEPWITRVIVESSNHKNGQQLLCIVSGLPDGRPRPVTPSMVKRLVEEGLDEGWKPDQRGRTQCLSAERTLRAVRDFTRISNVGGEVYLWQPRVSRGLQLHIRRRDLEGQPLATDDVVQEADLCEEIVEAIIQTAMQKGCTPDIRSNECFWFGAADYHAISSRVFAGRG